MRIDSRRALRFVGAMLDEGLGIADVLAREGDGPRRRTEIHAFFADLASWLNGTIGEGFGLPRWAERLKGERDRVLRLRLPVHVVVTGSSALRLGSGSRESCRSTCSR